MAQAMNYRMNLVIEPKNVIKANRELRAMERYFERIQGRVLRIGRTRMAPEIVLKDYASKGLDQILHKINRVKSQVIHASGTVKLKVEQGGSEAAEKRRVLKAPSKPQVLLAAPDFTPVVQAMNLNSVIVNINSGYIRDLTTVLGAIQFGGASAANEEESSWWEKIKSGVSFAKNTTATVKGITELPRKWSDAKKAFESTEPIGGSTKWEKFTNKTKDLWKNKNKIGSTSIDFLSTLTETLDSGVSAIDSVLPSGSSNSSVISKSLGDVAESGSGIVGKVIKRGGKLLGPLGYAMDAMDIANAKPGKERAEAIGSTVGSTLLSIAGGAIGTAILPGIGTAIGTALGSFAGDFLGGKVGGWISDQIPKIQEAYSSVTGWISDQVPKIQEAYSSVTGWISDQVPKIQEAHSLVAGWISDQVPKIQEAYSSVTGWISDQIPKEVKEAYTSATDWISDQVPKEVKEAYSSATDWISDQASKIEETFSSGIGWLSEQLFGKKDEPKEDLSKKPAVIIGPTVPEKQPVLPSTPLIMGPTLPPGFQPASFYSKPPGMYPLPGPSPEVGPGPRMQSAVSSNAAAGTSKVPQTVQISPEQMSELSGFLRDFKTETTNQFNLPAGAVQVTVHEEYPVDVEGIIQQVGQRLRAEFAKATQNRKPQSMALA
ncbi:hypothetical protein ACM1RC_24540 [Paenibacillus azoreducens]|uniref:hypothetical protein n=1 Tax=Paenibacillus azoreducens TaxID=116718 RepID=UPI0039F49E9E